MLNRIKKRNNLKKVAAGRLLSLCTAVLVLVISGCDADEIQEREVTLPSPVTSKTTPYLPDVDLTPPPLSVVVPPVTTPPATSSTTPVPLTTTTANPLTAFSNVPLSEYLGVEDETATTAENSDTSTATGTEITTVTDSNFVESYPDRVIFRPFEYASLTTPQKQLYTMMEDTFRSVSNSLQIPEEMNITADDFDTVFSIFLNKDPYDYYLYPSATTSYSKTTNKLYSVTFSYLYPKVNVTSRHEKTDSAVQQAVAAIRNKQGDYNRVIAIFELLSEKVTFDDNSDDSQNIYGALVDGRANCMGYSFAFKRLCNELGIEAITVSGTNTQGTPHMWNMVNIGGDWYHIDATFGDPDTGYINFDYCLTTDTRLLSGYKAEETNAPYPKAVSMEDNYYVRSGLFATTAPEATAIIREQIKTAIASKKPAVQILCATDNVYLNTETALLKADSPDNIVAILTEADSAGVLDVAKCTYLTNADTDVIKIVLVYK
ncbi:MAG: hypothetical protein LBM41_03290 [Ruminococcus sp.]|jgi:transglutaminase-like putative cysteine protease|nr:hypothetical protein [Ruminococcus sp.]